MTNETLKDKLNHWTERCRSFLNRGPLRGRLRLLPLPLLFAALALAVWLLPGAHINEGGTAIKTLRVPNFPVALVLEQKGGTVTSAWLRTPAGARQYSGRRVSPTARSSAEPKLYSIMLGMPMK